MLHQRIKLKWASLPLLLLFGCAPDLTLEEKYANYEEMVSSGAIERGWIPEWIPEDVVHIHEKHNLDTTAIALSFRIPTSQWLKTEVNCEEIPKAPKPHIKLGGFPKDVQKLENILFCDNFYVAQLGEVFFLWKNGS